MRAEPRLTASAAGLFFGLRVRSQLTYRTAMNAMNRIGSAIRRARTVRCMSLGRNTFAAGFVPTAV